MEKELIRCYEALELTFDATIEDVQARENALVKTIEDKAKESNKPCDKKVANIRQQAAAIIENLKKNGVPKEAPHLYDCDWKSIGYLALVCVCVVIFCWFSFYVFL